MKKTIAFLLAACLLLGLAACGAAPETDWDTRPTPDTAPEGGTADVPPVLTPDDTPEVPVLTGLRAAKDAFEVYSALTADLYGAKSSAMRIGGFVTDDAVVEAAAAEPMEAPAPEPEVYNGTKSAQADYSETNVQVAGVDEGDIVKTDGTYIYILRGMELLILLADGADSVVLWRDTVGSDTWNEFYDEDGSYTGSESESRYPSELYAADGRLAVLFTESRWSDRRADGTEKWTYEDEQKTVVDFYDVTDPMAPVRTGSFAQEGSFSTSRLTDGTLYLLSNSWVYDVQEDEPDSFLPHVWNGTERAALDAACIYLPERSGTQGYTVVSALDFACGTQNASLALLGGSDTAYMNGENLYLADSIGYNEESEPRTEDVYTVTDVRSVQKTQLTRISLADGGLTVAASGSVEGSLLNQFSMDEYGGYLRLVTTVSGQSYTVYRDEKHGFVNYEWPEEQQAQTNGLYVLDGSLAVVGSLTGLAESERVYSVRFDGNIGYFVTFRQTDPLFAVDLSEPTAPKMLSALKIPGFSEYLHVYGEGRLFGLGMDADEETGWTKGMKLTMFDVSDPADVTEKHTLLLDETWSEALYNHKAILISPEKDVIAFPSGNGYVIYGYSDAEGFYLRTRIDGDSDIWWSGDARGLYVGEYAYAVLSDAVWVLDLRSLREVCTILF